MGEKQVTEETKATKGFAFVRNVAALVALIDRLQNRSNSLPGMGTFYGPSGFGKSTAGIYATNKFGAVTIQVKSVWTKKSICEAILAELGVPAPQTVTRMLDIIVDNLARSGAPLLIDEADFLVQRKMIEIVRDIYEGSMVPVVLIGEELLPQKLRVWERVHGRILDWVPAQPADLSDLKHLLPIYAPGLVVQQDLQQAILSASHGSIRRIAVNLDRVREAAAIRGTKTVSLADWQGRDFFTGVAPPVRRFGESPDQRQPRKAG